MHLGWHSSFITLEIAADNLVNSTAIDKVYYQLLVIGKPLSLLSELL
jgi:hypothetical protein